VPFSNEEEFEWTEPPGHVRAYSRYLVGPDQGSRYFDFRVSRYPAGGRVEQHVHDVAEQVYYFISGTGEARCGGDDRAVGPGDLMFVPPGAPHSLVATGAGELRFVVVTSPPDDIAR
jgi:mannose-6-phosphate isomerase-like protein (cupin superfamily)